MSDWMPMNYHYDVSHCADSMELETWINQMGSHGWRCVSILPAGGAWLVTMERPQPPKESP